MAADGEERLRSRQKMGSAAPRMLVSWGTGMLIGTEASILEAVRRALPGRGPVRWAAPIGRGFAGESWRVEGEAGPMTARIALRDPDGHRLANAAAAASEARALGVVTPRMLHAATAHPAFGGRPFSVAEFLPGRDGEDEVPRMTAGDRARFFTEWGEAIARLHQERRDGGSAGQAAAAPARITSSAVFAADALGHGQAATWRDVVDGRLEVVPARFAAAGLDFGADAAEAVTRIRAGARAVSGVVRPTLVHNDLYLANTLAEAGAFAGLLDFEYARVWDPTSDFVKLTLLVFDTHSAARAAFLSGYRRVRPLPEDFEARLTVALGLELVSGLPSFHRWGDAGVLALYRRALERWLDNPAGWDGWT